MVSVDRDHLNGAAIGLAGSSTASISSTTRCLMPSVEVLAVTRPIKYGGDRGKSNPCTTVPLTTTRYATFVEQDPDFGVFLLKQSALLNDHVQLLRTGDA